MKKILIRVYLVLLSLCIISLIVLSVLGSKSRVGYLEISSFNENDSYSNNYIYSFQVKYYDKIFRNSDIYGVYLVANSLPEYIKEIKMNDNLGTPFGSLVSSKEIIENKVDNVKYILKLKSNIFLLFILLIISFFIFVYISDDLCVFIINFFYKIDYFFVLKKYIIPIILFIFAFFILFNISVNNIFIVFVLLVLLLFIKKLRNLSNIKAHYIISIFFSFLILPSIIYSLFGNYFDKNNYENRVLSKKVNIVNVKLNEYTIKYENYFNDHIPFRNELTKLKNLIDLLMFNNYISKDVLIGNNKWLFYKRFNVIEKCIGIKKYYYTKSDLEKMKFYLQMFNRELTKLNIDFFLMIAPYKEEIYYEYLPYYLKNTTEKTYIDEFIEYITNNTNIKIIYPKKLLLNYKNKYQLYYKYDNHWNALGAYIGFKELINKIYKTNYLIDDIKVITNNYEYRKESLFYNNMASMVRLSDIDYYKDDYIYNIDKYSYHNPILTYSNTISNYNNDYIFSNSICLIRDSYGAEIFDYIASSFKESYFIHIDNFTKEYLLDKNIDILIFETISPFLFDRLVRIIPNYKIEELNKYLEANSISTNN